MRLKLICYTPDIETLIATAILTTTTGAKPSVLYKRLRNKPNKIKTTVGRLELQHGSVLEHNRFTWTIEVTKSEVLRIILKNNFFKFTPLSDGKWLMSANLRTVMEYSSTERTEFRDALVDSVSDLAPSLKALSGRMR